MNRNTKKKFPCLFVFEGAIKIYDKSMLVFHTKITMEEWMLVVEETVKYHQFLIALKEVGMPRLQEKWTKLHEYFLRGLEVNVARMRNIDPLVIAKIDTDSLLKAYKYKMEVNSEELLKDIQVIKDQIETQAADNRTTTKIDLGMVSDL